MVRWVDLKVFRQLDLNIGRHQLKYANSVNAKRVESDIRAARKNTKLNRELKIGT